MRGGSGLALAYVLGLVALAATRRREGLQRVLVRAKLLLPPADADWGPCVRHVPFAAGVSMKNGDALRGCAGECAVGTCEPSLLRLTAQGALILHRGADSSAPVAWKVATEPWWRRLGPPRPYRATIHGDAVELYSQGALRKTAPLAQLHALSDAIGYDAPPQSAVSVTH